MRNPSTNRALRSAWTVCRLTGSLRFPTSHLYLTVCLLARASRRVEFLWRPQALHCETLGLFGLSGGTAEERYRKAERQSCAHFVDWMATRESMTQPNVETEIVANPPDETDQTGYRLRSTKFLFIEKLCNRPDCPFRWSLYNAAKKQISMMVAGKGSLSVQVDRSPVPALGDDSGQTSTDTRIPRAVGKEHAKFRLNTRPGLILQTAGLEDM